ncbi:MAG: hypothetical protein B7Z55_07495 [Planctomycetales bacterium 12-60-4]|nr:MAG: hypothetical protein B7Z55_07495 [Planctomycetales bacterium 12-60-4]
MDETPREHEELPIEFQRWAPWTWDHSLLAALAYVMCYLGFLGIILGRHVWPIIIARISN